MNNWFAIGPAHRLCLDCLTTATYYVRDCFGYRYVCHRCCHWS